MRAALQDLTRRLVVKTAKRVIARLSGQVRRALAVEIEPELDYAALQRLAERHGIHGFVAEGEYGAFEGAVADASIFPVYAASKVWAAETNGRFAAFLKDGGTYVDVGANIGLTSIPQAANPAVTCIAIEPDPANFALLRANVVRSGYANISLHALAVFERETRLRLERSAHDCGDHRIRQTERDGEYGEAQREVVSVAARPLDAIVGEIAGPVAAKVDTQGAEPFVVRGGRRTLEAAGMLAIEFWPYGMARLGGDPAEVIEFLAAHFERGAWSGGDRDAFGDWQPVADLVARLEAFAFGGACGREYLDVLVAK